MFKDTRSSAERLAAAVQRLDLLVDWERRDRSAGMVRSLDPVRDLVRRLGDPHERFRAVHVGGTKGKGSVAALVAAALESARLRVGCYASPHVERMGERVRIGGADVGDEVLAEGVERALEARDQALAEASPGGEATWFDVVTSAAFWIFAARGVEWAVVEVGLGGRLDSTNVLRGEVCVVTNVDLEHTAVLGRTRAAIAAEKGQILKAGGVLVTGVERRPELAPAEDAFGVLQRIAEERGGRFRPVELRGTLAQRNRALAAAVLEELGRLGVAGPGGPVDARSLDARAVDAARLPARMELFTLGSLPVVLDAAHVASSVSALLDEAPALAGRSCPPQVVLALGRDKDAAAILKALAGRVDRVHCTTSSSGPLRSPAELLEVARTEGLDSAAHAVAADALEAARRDARASGWVLVLGSFYLAGELRPMLTRAADRPTRSDPC